MNTLFFLTEDKPNNIFHQMSATTNYLQNDSPLELQPKSPTRFAGTLRLNIYSWWRRFLRELINLKQPPAKGTEALIQRLDSKLQFLRVPVFALQHSDCKWNLIDKWMELYGYSDCEKLKKRRKKSSFSIKTRSINWQSIRSYCQSILLSLTAFNHCPTPLLPPPPIHPFH